MEKGIDYSIPFLFKYLCIMRFDDFPISRELKKNIADLGYKKPTDIQFKAIPSILRGEDVLGIAQTGTGKTASFVIPLIYLVQKKLRENKRRGVQCIVFEPTHELALQITEVFQSLVKNTGVKVVCLQGGVDQDPQIEALKKGAHIVVTTPGRMFDLTAQKHLDLQYVEHIVLDEADHMLDLGFIKDVKDLAKWVPRKRQTLFFSATINEQIKKIAYKLVKNPIRIQISPKDPVSKNVDHAVMHVTMDDKRHFLEHLIEENPEAKVLVFVRTLVRAERVVKAMARVDYDAVALHREKTDEERREILHDFKSGGLRLLIATDISARGIDIPDVDLVVNYDLPDKAENYVHRVGRTGRGRNRGYAVSFCSEEERDTLIAIESFLGKDLDVIEVNKSQVKTIQQITDLKTSSLEDMMKEIDSLENYQRKNKKKVKGSRKKK